MNNLKILQNSIRKYCIYHNNFKTFECDFIKEQAYFINFKSSSNIISEFNEDILFFKSLYIKTSDVIETINNLVITNLKGVNLQSISEKNLYFKEIKNLIFDINIKENELKSNLDKYYNKKKLLEKLTNNLETAKTNSVRYELIVKIEMDIKIATKNINEIQTALSIAADNYKESRSSFSEKSLKLYLQFMKHITREYEVLRALLLSFFEFLNELTNSLRFKIFNKTRKLSTDSDINFSNELGNTEFSQMSVINKIFNDFICNYFINSDKAVVINRLFINSDSYSDRKNLLSKNEMEIKSFIINDEKEDNLNEGVNDSFQKKKYLNNSDKNSLILSPVKNIENNSREIQEKENLTKKPIGPLLLIKNEMTNIDNFVIENPEIIKVKSYDFTNTSDEIQKSITCTFNKLKELIDTKLNFLKKNSTLLNYYAIISNQIINAFSEFYQQSKKSKKSKINYFFEIFNYSDDKLYELDKNETINLNLIFIKLFNIANKISDDLSNHTDHFCDKISPKIKMTTMQEKNLLVELKFLSEKFNNFLQKTDGIFKVFFNEINFIKKEKINNKSLFELKLRKIAENFIIKKVVLQDEIKPIIILYDEILQRTFDNLKAFEAEFQTIKYNYVNSLNLNCNFFINLLQKSAKELKNCYNIEEEIKNIPKLKEKINNEFLEFIVFNRDYKLNIIHEKKCSFYSKKDSQMKNSNILEDDKSPNQKHNNNLFNETNLNYTSNNLSFSKGNLPEIGKFINNFQEKKKSNLDNQNLSFNKILLDDNAKIKNSYFQKIKNFLLKRTGKV